MIPRIVHQTWKDATIDYWIFKRSQASVKAHLGHWEYRLWTDADLDEFIKEDFPSFHEAWKALDRQIKRVDTARYCILYKHGGLYADLDFIFTRSIDDLIDEEHGIYLYKSRQAIVKNWEFLGNALMISKPRQQFWLGALEYMFSLPATTGVLHHTGPRALGAYYASLAEKPDVKILSPDIFEYLGWSSLVDKEDKFTKRKTSKSLTTVLKESGAPKVIDYCVIDVENAFIEVTMNLDLSAFEIRLLAVEIKPIGHYCGLVNHVLANGYELRHIIPAGPDYIFVKR